MLEGQTFTAALPGLPELAGTPRDRLGRFLAMVGRFERDDIEAAVDGLIAMLDERDGDPDREPNGDERDVSVTNFDGGDPAYRLAEHRDADFALATEDAEDDGDAEDGNRSEDDFMQHDADGPGCRVADPDVAADDHGQSWGTGDRSYAEWHTLPPTARRAGHLDGTPIGGWSVSLDDDVEADEPAELNGDEEDTTFAEDEGGLFGLAGVAGPGCALSDDDSDRGAFQ